MTEDTVWILMCMLLAAAFAFMIGWVCAEQVCRRKNAEEKVAELSDQLPRIKELRSVLNDAHKRIVAVSKGLKNPAR